MVVVNKTEACLSILTFQDEPSAGVGVVDVQKLRAFYDF